MLIPNFSSGFLAGFKHVSILSPCSRCTSVVRNYRVMHSRQNAAMGGLKTRPATYSYLFKLRTTSLSSVIKQSQVTLSSSVGSQKCWKCQSCITPNSEFCPSCESLQPLDKQKDHLSVLGIQKNFTIDTKALTKRFRMLQAQFHPDRYTLKPEKEQEFAHDHSSAVNKAYRCLLHPVNRAVYLLDLAGQPLHEGQLDLESEFLVAVMEMNEELAEAEDRDTIQAVGQRNMAVLNSLLSEADSAFSSNDIGRARVVVAKIKYYNSIYEKVKALEREYGIVE